MIFCICCNQGICAQSEIDRWISRVESRYGTMKDFQAEFKQETFLSSINKIEKGSGSVYFKKDALMLWEYKSPAVQKIILDGTNLWFYLPEENQVMKNNYSTIPRHIVIDLFRGKIEIQKKFKVSSVQSETKEQQTEIALELLPIIYNPTMTKLTLWIDPKKSYIIRTSLEDEFGNKTVLKFFNIEIDKGIDDTLFQFTPPPGVEIFEPPQF
jgi:outer membrane lipoprotein carrier protein